MLKHFRKGSPNGRLDRHFAQGYWEGYMETFPSELRLDLMDARPA